MRRDRWLRKLLKTLDYNNGVIAVVAGRGDPCWRDASDDYYIDDDLIHFHEVGFFSEEDANDYLERAGISNRPLRESLVQYASVKPNKIQPLYAGLCADVVLQATIAMSFKIPFEINVFCPFIK